MYFLDLNAAEPPASVSTKCPTCKKPTEQFHTNIMPMSDTNVDPMKQLELTKRLIICSECGNLRLIN